MPASGRPAGHHGPTVPGLAERHGHVQCWLAGRPQRALPHLQGPAQLWGQPPRCEDRLSARQPDRLPGPLISLRRHLLHRCGWGWRPEGGSRHRNCGPEEEILE